MANRSDHLIKHVGTKKNLKSVIINKRIPKAERLSVAHEQGPDYHHPAEVSDNESCCWYRRIHQW